MKKLMVLFMALMSTMVLHAQSTVYMTKEISPAALVRIYKALGVPAHGHVAIKISSGEMGGNNYLKPTLIRDLVDEVNGTLVECCTAYGGSRQDKGKHWETIHAHGFDSIAAVDLMDEFGQMRIPIKDKKHLKYDIVGDHLASYDFMINLAHFKGHAMGGFGGVLKTKALVWHPRQEKPTSIQQVSRMTRPLPGRIFPSRMIFWKAWQLQHRLWVIISVRATSSTST